MTKNVILEKIKTTEQNLSDSEKIYQKARELYQEKAKLFDLDETLNQNGKVNKEKKWTYDIIKTGTFQDKISAMSLYIRKEPKFTLKYLDILMKIVNLSII